MRWRENSLKRNGFAIFRKIILLVFVSLLLSSAVGIFQFTASFTAGLRQTSTAQFEDWQYSEMIVVKEPVGIDRVFEPVDYLISFDDGECLNASKEIRVATAEGVEVPSQVYNITTYGSGYAKFCNVLFFANCTANSITKYFIYYGNPDASEPTYLTDLSHWASDFPLNITIENSHYKVGYIQEPYWDYPPFWITYLSYKPYDPNENLLKPTWERMFQIVTHKDGDWYVPWEPLWGTNTYIVRQGPLFIDVATEFDWYWAGIEYAVITFRFYANVLWFTYRANLSLTGEDFHHLLISSYFSLTTLPYGAYRGNDGSLKIAAIKSGVGDITNWNGTWIDAENNATASADNPVGVGIITLNGTTPLWTGWRSDQGEVAPYLTGSLSEAQLNLAANLHEGNYTATEQLYEKLRRPLMCVVSETVPPVADAGSDQTVNEDTLVIFNGSGSWDNVLITNYTWTFTDETPKTLTGMNPNYTFSTPGIYTITLNVTDFFGNSATDTVVIAVLDVTPPVADAGSNQTVKVGEPVTFNASGSTDNVGVVSCEWDYGDGTNGTGVLKFHTYLEPGNYTVTLTVKDAAGNNATATVTVTVEAVSPAFVWQTIVIVGLLAPIAILSVAVVYLLKMRKPA